MNNNRQCGKRHQQNTEMNKQIKHTRSLYVMAVSLLFVVIMFELLKKLGSFSMVLLMAHMYAALFLSSSNVSSGAAHSLKTPKFLWGSVNREPSGAAAAAWHGTWRRVLHPDVPMPSHLFAWTGVSFILSGMACVGSPLPAPLPHNRAWCLSS